MIAVYKTELVDFKLMIVSSSRCPACLNLTGNKRTMVLLLCAFPAEIMDIIEAHYAKYRHTEAALGLHNLSDDTLRPGTCRFKGKGDSVWSNIMTVTEEAVRRITCARRGFEVHFEPHVELQCLTRPGSLWR